MVEADVEEIENKLFDLREKLRSLNLRIRESEEAVSSYAAKRDKIHEEMKPFSAELKKLRESRAEERARLQELREKLAEKKAELQARREELSKIKEELRKLRGVRDEPEEIKKRLEEIDWRIQTMPLPREEERRLSEELIRLEQMLGQVQRKKQLKQKAEEIGSEIGALKEEIQALREEIGKLKGELSGSFEQSRALREKLTELKQKADGWHAKYLEAKKELQRLEAEKILLSSQIIELQNLLRKIRELEEENTRLKRELEELRKRKIPEVTLTPMEERRIREWVSNLKSRLRAFANTQSRRKLLKLLVSIDEKREFYPEWISTEIGMSSDWARRHLKQLSLLFRVGIVTLDGEKMSTSLVESRVLKRRVIYRNNIREYVRVCLNMLVPGVDRSVVERILNEIYSFVYSL